MRRKKTIRRALLFLLLLAVALKLQLVCFTPTQAIRAVERNLGLEPTELVMEKDGLYLSENEDVLLLTPGWLGRWYGVYDSASIPFLVMDKTGAPPVVGGGFWMPDHDHNRETFHLFGTVLLEEAVSVRACSDIDPDYETTSVDLTAQVFQADNGKRYFWSVTERDLEAFDFLPNTLEALDAHGNVIAVWNTEIPWQIEYID